MAAEVDKSQGLYNLLESYEDDTMDGSILSNTNISIEMENVKHSDERPQSLGFNPARTTS